MAEPSKVHWRTKLARRLRGVVSQKKRRFKEESFDLDLTYISHRVVAMGFPSSGTEGIYRNPLPEVQRFFNRYHPGKHMIYNLCSEREYDPAAFEGRVQRFPFDDHNPCPLHMIADFCKSVDEWLAKDKDNIVAVHCKAGKGRTGLMISAYLLHSGFKPTAQRALAFFGDARTANAKGVTIPSQMRYVHYYEHELKYGPAVPKTFKITHVRVLTVPNVELKGGCVPYVTVHVDNNLVFDMKKSVTKLQRYRRHDPVIDIDVDDFECIIHSNVRVTLMHDKLPAPSKLCHVWFHTGYVAHNYLAFSRENIDKACKDTKNRFSPGFGLEIYLEWISDSPPSKTRRAALSTVRDPLAFSPVELPSDRAAIPGAGTSAGVSPPRSPSPLDVPEVPPVAGAGGCISPSTAPLTTAAGASNDSLAEVRGPGPGS